MELRTAEEELGKELAEIYKREYQKLTDRDSDLLYMPATDSAKWWCSCGVMNLTSQMHCRVCGASIADLSKIMWKDYLQGIYDKEHPEEAKARDQVKTEEPEPVVAEEPEPVILEEAEPEPVVAEEPELIILEEPETVVMEEPEAKIEPSYEEPADEPVKLTGSRSDEPEPVMLNVIREDEPPEMGKIGLMSDDDNEYEDTRLGETEDNTIYYDAPKGAVPDADTVLGIPSETEDASVSLSSDISFPDSDDEEMTEVDSANIVFGDNDYEEKEVAEISEVSFPSDLAEEYAAEVLTVEDMMSDIDEVEEPEPGLTEEDDGPLIKLEKALEMPGFGKVESMDAGPEDESVEYLAVPDESEEPVKEDKPKKPGRFGGLFGKKKAKEEKQPEVVGDLKLKEEPELNLESPEPVETEAPIPQEELPQEELPQIEFPQEEPPREELPQEELPQIEFPQEEEELPVIELKQVPQGELPDMPFSSEEKNTEPSVIEDEDGNPQIVFPDSPSSESRFGDLDELDFPDATIPESPLPDPVEQPVLPRVEFPDGPQLEVKMNPEPENKEKARPFRNPGAAEKTSSGLIVSEVKTEEAKEPEAVPATEKKEKKKEHDTAKFLLVTGIVVGILALCFLGFLAARRMFGNSEATSAVETATASIQKLEESAIPTQEDFNRALNDYNSVPYDRKNEVTNATVLERFKDVDLKTVRDISMRMEAVDDHTPFSEIMSLESEYGKLTVQEKQFVDGTKLDKFKSLNEMEKSALKAIGNIRSLLLSSDNFKVLSVKVKDDTGMSMSYRMQIEYSFVDEMGTVKQNKTYLSMMSESDDVAYNEAVNSGDHEAYTTSSKEKATYDKCESDEIEIDVDKMMFYLNS